MTANLAPPGVVLPYAGSTAPTAWLLCDGSAVSRTTYADLYAAIGTTYGTGDGSTTFNLPDLRGRAAAGKDNMGGTAANRLTSGGSGLDGTTLGAAGGAETHTLTIPQMPAHDHTVKFTANLVNSASATTAAVSASGTTNVSALNQTGGGGAHNNTQPTLVLNYIIKT
jgi:microcystin-dependent protein